VDLHRSSSLTIASDLDLHVGELAAIQLGVDLQASLIMIDEVAGRAEARRRGLEVIGTLGVLDLADARGLTDFKQALAKLRTTTFRASPRLISQFLDRYQTRQGTGI
jgi:predicted nucleic acid-binding protein